MILLLCLLAVLARAGWAQPPPCSSQPVYPVHDPAGLMRDEQGNLHLFCTGQNILHWTRPENSTKPWQPAPTAFDGPAPWQSHLVPGFFGDFWAPDVTYLDGRYRMVYAVSTFGSQTSCIGQAHRDSLSSQGPWIDDGPLICSNSTTGFNAIDPHVLKENSTGNYYMVFGSFFAGVYVVPLTNRTGPLTVSGNGTLVATDETGGENVVEASWLHFANGYYYLFVNWGYCCRALNSTYNIRVGRSRNILGPFYDRDNQDMAQGGGTLLLGSEGFRVGPGQTGIYNNNLFTFHFYDGRNVGQPALGMAQLSYDSEQWPVLSNICG